MRSGRPTTIPAFLKLFADVVRTIRTVASASDKPKILANAGSRAVRVTNKSSHPGIGWNEQILLCFHSHKFQSEKVMADIISPLLAQIR